ncbi:MAG: hypothetical protein ITG02_13820 [Patulibacter sp.]|nr:hypothetical protein [Patulibacter sp.]
MQLPSSRSFRSFRARRGAVLVGIALAGLAASAPAASAATPAQIQTAVERGADYLEAQQSPDGRFLGFGGDWALSSLTAAGRDADTIRATPDGPSALAAYRTLWTSGPDGDEDWTTPSGPDPFTPPPALLASDYSRALLLGHAIGLEPTRLSADQNLVAQLAGIYHGRPATGETPDVGRIEGNFGDPAPMSGATGNLFALSRTAAPQVLLDTVADVVRSNQLDDGSWSWNRVTDPSERADSWRGDIDMTAQAIGALCDIGVRPTDPAIVRGLAYLHGGQISNGAIATSWAPSGNINSTAAVVMALNACGVDPQGAEWTTGASQNPLDFLIANQLTTGPDAGGFPLSLGDAEGDLYASQEAVRALTGSGYVADPSRTVSSPKVPDGAVVPQALVVDAGIDATDERDLRVCRVMAPVGATVAELLEAAASSAQPAGCVTGLSVVDGTVRALNGVTGDSAQRTWLARVEGGAVRRAGDEPVCHGQIVALYVGRAASASTAAPAPCTAPADPDPPVDPSPQPPSPPQPPVPPAPLPVPIPVPPFDGPQPPAAPVPALGVAGSGAKQQRSVRYDRRGRIRVTLRCPSSAGSRGCWSVVTARSTYRSSPRSEARTRRVGGRTVRVKSGQKRTFRVRLSSALRRDLRRVGKRRVRIEVRTQGADADERSKASVRVTVRARR